MVECGELSRQRFACHSISNTLFISLTYEYSVYYHTKYLITLVIIYLLVYFLQIVIQVRLVLWLQVSS
jgi:hypothetical protein